MTHSGVESNEQLIRQLDMGDFAQAFIVEDINTKEVRCNFRCGASWFTIQIKDEAKGWDRDKQVEYLSQNIEEVVQETMAFLAMLGDKA